MVRNPDVRGHLIPSLRSQVRGPQRTATKDLILHFAFLMRTQGLKISH